MTKTVTTIRELRLAVETWRRREEAIGFVPTMGALHGGHMALVSQAQKLATRTVVSIFVNPTQFAPSEDLSRYPRQPEKDLKLLEEAGVDILFMPSVDEVYPEGFATKIDPGPLATLWEGAVRPGHFTGVASVVLKLFLQVMPDYAFFGEKDFQQLRVVEQIVRDLHVPVNIVPVTIVREEDGLALSSRNIYLSPDERERAVELPLALQEAVSSIHDGHDIDTCLHAGRERLEAAGFKVDYFEMVEVRTLAATRDRKKPTRLIAAARMGATRLLDNLSV